MPVVEIHRAYPARFGAGDVVTLEANGSPVNYGFGPFDFGQGTLTAPGDSVSCTQDTYFICTTTTRTFVFADQRPAQIPASVLNNSTGSIVDADATHKGKALLGAATGAATFEAQQADAAAIVTANTNIGNNATAIGLKAAKASNLSDLADAGSARANILVPQLQSAMCAATANVASKSTLLTIDGYTLVAGDIVLLTAQTTPAENGPWVAAAGAWTRPTDFPSTAVVKSRCIVVVNGIVGAGLEWYLSLTASITVDTNAQTWVQGTIPDATTTVKGKVLFNITGGAAAFDTVTPLVKANRLFQPVDWGIKAWNYDPFCINSASISSSGILFAALLRITEAFTIANAVFEVATAGSTFTAGQSFAAVWDGTTLANLGKSASSIEGSLAAQSLLQTPMTAVTTLAVTPGQLVWVGLWSVATTAPQYGRSPNTLFSSMVNNGITKFTQTSGKTTVVPDPIVLTANAITIWVGLS